MVAEDRRSLLVREVYHQLSKVEALERTLGVSFRRKELLSLALVHSSYLNENPGAFSQSNERLEFLGDAVIGAVVAHELYCRHPGWSEGELTQARSALVRGGTLTHLAAGLHLGEYLYMGKGEDAGGGRERPTNLAATLEALVGAFFLDQGYRAVRELVLRILSDELSALGRRGPPKNPKSALQEMVQDTGLQAPSYRIEDASGDAHARLFTAVVTVEGRAVGRGTGASKSQAEQAAAEAALKALREET